MRKTAKKLLSILLACTIAVGGNGFSDLGDAVSAAETVDLNAGSTSISIGTETTGSVEKDAVNYYKFTTSSNESFYSMNFAVPSGSGVYYEIYSDSTATSRIANKSGMSGGASNTVDLDKLISNHTYYIKVGASNTSSYKFTFTETQDDLGDASSSALEVSVGSECTGYGIQNDSDIDWFKITTSANDSFYTFNFATISGQDMQFWLYYDADGTNQKLNRWNIDAGDSKTDALGKLEKNHTYYLKVTGNIGTYKFSMSESVDDIGDTMDTAMSVNVDTEYSSYALQDYNDVDCFAFTTTANDSFYTFDFANISGSDLQFYIYYDKDATNEVLHKWSISAGESTSNNMGKLEKNHTYYLKVLGYAASYKFKTTEYKDDVSDTFDGATSILLDKTYSNYQIQSDSDVDCFKVTTSGNDSFYTFTFACVSGGNLEYYIYYDKDGTNEVKHVWSITPGDGFDTDLAKLEKNHTYYIKVSGGVSDYKFQMKENKDDISDDATSAKTVKLSKTYKSWSLQSSSDVDCYKIKTGFFNYYNFKISNLSVDGTVYAAIYSGKTCTSDTQVGYEISCGIKGSNYEYVKLKANKTYYIKIYGNNTGKYSFGMTNYKLSQLSGYSSAWYATKGYAYLKWDVYEGVNGYQLYRATKRAGKYKMVAKLKSSGRNYYNDGKVKKGKTYYYKIRAYKKTGSKTKYTAYSNILKIKVNK